nr:aldehyde dehydrogenase family protein [Halomonas socia]
MTSRTHLYIEGDWIAPTGHQRITVQCPASEAIIGDIPAGTTDDVNAAVKAAHRAFPAWAATPAGERAAILARIQAGLEERAEEIAQLITSEMGMPLKLTRRIQAILPAASFGMYAKLLPDFPLEESVGNSRVLREPVGVVACITPWNYPLHQIAAKVAAALAAGCTVVLKPSELAPLNAFVLAEIIHAAGLPAGVFNLVTGDGATVGEALAGHPEVDMVSLTGSTRAGKRVSTVAANSVKRVALELGGKSPSVLLDDADLAKAVKATVANCFLNSGQNCNAYTRLLVPEEVHDEAAALAANLAEGLAVGDPLDAATRIGPLVSAEQREAVLDYIRVGIREGATLLAGGEERPAGFDKGHYIRPTVFGRVDPRATIAQEEIFGPVLAVIPYTDEAHAVEIANNTIYGLAGAVWSADDARAERVARRIRAGQIDINGGPFNLKAPFGGFKQSGHGRELGRYGLEEFLEYKALQLQS